MYALIEDLREADLETLIPDEKEIEDILSEYKDYSNNHYDDDKISFEEFCDIFGIDEYDEDMTLEEQLNVSLNELLGITRPQLKFIDFDLSFNRDVVHNFIRAMNASLLQDYDVEQRIKLASVLAYMHESAGNMSDFDFCLRAIKGRQIREAITIINEYRDYKKMANSIEAYMNTADFVKCVKQEDREMLIERFKELDVEYIKPSHVHDMHGKMVRFKREFDRLYESETNEFKDNLIRETTNAPLYKKFLYEGKEYQIHPINSYSDLKFEGEMLSHCVADYANDIIESKCLIYAVRENNAPDTPLYTVEVKRGDTVLEGGQFRLNQCYGYDDTIDKPESMRNFIFEWCRKKNIRVDCEV